MKAAPQSLAARFSFYGLIATGLKTHHWTRQVEMTEEWRDIPGYDGDYQVSNLGGVRSYKASLFLPRLMKPSENISGYHVMVLSKDGKPKTCMVHRLVALAFIGECPDDYQVNHKDKNRKNNTPENLEYVTHWQNQYHKMGVENYLDKNVYLYERDMNYELEAFVFFPLMKKHYKKVGSIHSLCGYVRVDKEPNRVTKNIELALETCGRCITTLDYLYKETPHATK